MLRVMVREKIVHAQSFGYADLEQKIAFTDRSMFTFYSMSKPLCAIGLLRLADAGLVDIDAHPGKYVPEAAGFHENVTIRQLLHHTSGLPDFEQNIEQTAVGRPGYAHLVRKQLPLLARCPALFEPGTAGHYENINFLLCALIIENVTGLDYADYMRREVFAPLGMATAVVDNERLEIPGRIRGYEEKEQGLVPVRASYDWMLGAGDIVGTVDDAYGLNRAVKHRLLLREETWNQVLPPSPVSGMGMGCSVTEQFGKTVIRHNGGHRGFRTLHVQIPEDDFDLILLSNSGFGNARADLYEMICSSYYRDDRLCIDGADMDQGYI